MSRDRYRVDDPDDDHERIIIDLRTPPGALSRSDLRRLRQELEHEVLARRPASRDPGPQDERWDPPPAPRGRPGQRRDRDDLRRDQADRTPAYPDPRQESPYPPQRPGERRGSPALGYDLDQQWESFERQWSRPERQWDHPNPLLRPEANPLLRPEERHDRPAPEQRPEPYRDRPQRQRDRADERRDRPEPGRDRAGPQREARRPAPRPESPRPESPRPEPPRARPGRGETPTELIDRGTPLPAGRPAGRRPERDLPIDRRPPRDRTMERRPERDRSGEYRSAHPTRDPQTGGQPVRRSSAAEGSVRRRGGSDRPASRARSPLLIRTTVVVALIAALAASVQRADMRTPNTGVTRGTTTGNNVPGNATAAAGQAQQDRGAQTVARSRIGNTAGVTPSTAPVVPAPNPETITMPAAPAIGGDGNGGTEGKPAATCNISYSVTPENAKQFTVAMVIANTGTKKINGWTLRWDFPPKQKIIYGWNAMVTNGPGGAAASGIGMDQVIAPGANVTIGFAGKRGAWIPTPTGFTLNGQTCQWQPSTGITPS